MAHGQTYQNYIHKKLHFDKNQLLVYSSYWVYSFYCKNALHYLGINKKTFKVSSSSHQTCDKCVLACVKSKFNIECFIYFWLRIILMTLWCCRPNLDLNFSDQYRYSRNIRFSNSRKIHTKFCQKVSDGCHLRFRPRKSEKVIFRAENSRVHRQYKWHFEWFCKQIFQVLRFEWNSFW